MPFIPRLLALLLILLAPAAARAETRIALVIGNAGYQSVPTLQNAAQDARSIAEHLTTDHFDVIFRENLDRRSFNRAIDDFVGRLSSDSVAVLYFAGHGVQIGATNYLLGTDIRADRADDIAADGIDLSRVLDRITATQARFALAIIDACRDNPFRVAGRSLGTERGLAPSTTANGVMVVYSAGANQTALDSLGPNDTSPNGVFTREWLRAMDKPGVSIQQIAVQVRQDVATLAKSVGHVQTPAVYDQSLGDFTFVPAGLSTTTPTTIAPTAPATATPTATAPAVTTPATPVIASTPGAAIPVQACDRLAQPPRAVFGTMRALAEGIGATAIDVPAARTACAQAMRDYPNEPRFIAYAARTADVGKDTATAFRLYQAAAAAGNPVGQSNLGVFYENGQGTRRDDREAVRLYQLAADQGYPPAQNNLANMYAHNRGVSRDDREAVRLWQLATDQGLADAQTNLGVMYAEGRGGLPRNNAEAIRLWNLAAQQGNATAARNLRRITGR